MGRRTPAYEATLESAGAGAPPGGVGVGHVLAGKYRIDAILGTGGMGTVYRGWHLTLHRTVAIKMMHADAMSEDAARRFAREARAAASIDSVHVTRIIDIDRLPNGVPFIVMEHLVGRDLHDTLLDSGPLEWSRAVRYALQAAEALGEAHALGVIHRDLKPQNLFVTDEDVLKVLDFGIAKTLPDSVVKGDSVETTAGIIGSPHYMAPEQIHASAVDARTDVYGLGATLYELLAGVPPFDASNLYTLCARILDASPPRFADVRPDVPDALERVVRRCLEKRAELRYPSMAELAADLRAVLLETTLPMASTVAVGAARVIERTVPMAHADEVARARAELARLDSVAPPRAVAPPNKGAVLLLAVIAIAVALVSALVVARVLSR